MDNAGWLLMELMKEKGGTARMQCPTTAWLRALRESIVIGGGQVKQ